MRIAFFTTRMLLGYGVDLAIAEISKRLCGYGHEITVYATTYDDTYKGLGFEIRKLEIRGGELNRAFPIFELNARSALRRMAGELEEYDVLIPATFPFYGIWSVQKKPTVFLDFGNVPTTGFTWKGKLNWTYLHLMETYLHSVRAKKVVTISKFLSKRFLPEVRNNARVVYLGGDHYFTKFEERGVSRQEARSLARQELGIDENEIVVGCCTRLHRRHAPYKGLQDLVLIFQELRKRHQVRLLVAGIGSAEDVEWLKRNRVIPLANIHPSKMPDFYVALDIYATLSRWEGLNLPILEASWFSVPSVALNVGAHPEIPVSILANGVEEFTEQVSRLSLNKEERTRLGQTSKNKAQRFNWETASDEFQDVLIEVNE